MNTTHLAKIGLFSNWDDAQLAALATHGVSQSFSKGDSIITQGDPQCRLYFLHSGELEVVYTENTRTVPLAAIRPGEVFGEVGIFEPGPASATVRGAKPGFIWFIEVEQLQNYLEAYPQTASNLILSICQLLSRRLRHANQIIRENKLVPGFHSVRNRLRQVPPALPQ